MVFAARCVVFREDEVATVICLQRREGWEVIFQRAHALMAYEILGYWREDLRPPCWSGLLAACAQHDNGWAEWEPRGRLSPAGAPMDFRQVELEPILEQAERAVALGWHQDAVVGWLISRHMDHLYQPRRQELPELARWLDRQREARAARARALPYSTQTLEGAYRLLLWADTLSLTLCEEQMPFDERSLELGQDDRGTGYLTWRTGAGGASSQGEVHIWPWPFGHHAQLEVHVESRTLQELTFRDHDQFLRRLAGTLPTRNRFRLVPGRDPRRLGPPLEALSLKGLRQRARELDIAGRSRMEREQLVEAIAHVEAAAPLAT